MGKYIFGTKAIGPAGFFPIAVASLDSCSSIGVKCEKYST